MKSETAVYFKVARNQTPKREHLSKRQAWENKASSGRVNRDKKANRELNNLF